MTERRITARTYARPEAMPVATKRPFAFVHINKCGGSSVEIALGIQKDHQSAMAIRDAVGGQVWDTSFTFSIVRNPFARVVSIYYYRVRADLTGLADRHLSLNAWVERVWGAKDPAYLDDALMLAPAHDWLAKDGEVLVDHVGRLEDLDEHWPVICKALGIEVDLPVTNQNAHPPYRAVLSPSARKTLETAFQADLDQFGYAW